MNNRLKPKLYEEENNKSIQAFYFFIYLSILGDGVISRIRNDFNNKEPVFSLKEHRISKISASKNFWHNLEEEESSVIESG